MPQYDFRSFLKSVQEMDSWEILQVAESEVYATERGLYGVRGAPARRRLGGEQCVRELKTFLFFMRSGTRPGSASDDDFRAYRPVCESLVQRGRFKPEILDMFRRAGPDQS